MSLLVWRDDLPGPGAYPGVEPMPALVGQHVRLEKLDWSKHASLFDAIGTSEEVWRYMPRGPWSDESAFRSDMDAMLSNAADPFVHFVVVRLRDERVIGCLSLLRIRTAHRSVEVGQVAFSPADMQRTPASTEAQLLLAAYVFDELKYRRYEWKCDSSNAKSHAAALRLGFVFEGTFRQDMIIRKNGLSRTRDTAWLSITDAEWPVVKHALTDWLSADNFDALGQQRQTLLQIRSRLQSRPVC